MSKRTSARRRRDARARAKGLLGRLGVPPEEAASLVAALPELPEDSFASRALRQGGDTVQAWQASRDPNVPRGSTSSSPSGGGADLTRDVPLGATHHERCIMAYPTRLLMSGFVTHDTRRFVLERPEGLDFEPGQGVELTIERDPWRGEGHPFTPTCLPQDQVLELTIKRYPESDGFTVALHDLEPGAPLTVSDAFGTITYQGPGVFIGAGAGITPFLAILRRLADDGALEGHGLLFSNKSEADLICGAELRHYLGERAVFAFTRENQPGHTGRRIDADFLREHIDDFDRFFYVCGPPAFVEDVKRELVTLGADPDRLVYER